MKIFGLQKTTLLDFPGNVACTIFTGGCNFRCPFCHNASLVLTPNENEIIPEEEIFAFLQKRKGILDGVCITGGEPLLNRDIKSFIRRVKDIGFLVKLDTNGAFPDILSDVLQDNLIDYVAVDIKNSPNKYNLTCGVEVDLHHVQKTVSMLLQRIIPYEFRTTVVRELHTSDDILQIGEWLSGAKRYYLQAFKDSGNLIGGGFSPWTENEMQSILPKLRDYIFNVEIRGL